MMKKPKLTKKQNRVLDAIRKKPNSTFEELRVACSFKFVGSVQSAVKRLIAKGFLQEKEPSEWKVL